MTVLSKEGKKVVKNSLLWKDNLSKACLSVPMNFLSQYQSILMPAKSDALDNTIPLLLVVSQESLKN